MVANNLKGRIVANYGSQADFAQKLQIDETVVSRVLHGRKKLPKEERHRWAKALNCQPQELFRCWV